MRGVRILGLVLCLATVAACTTAPLDPTATTPDASPTTVRDSPTGPPGPATGGTLRYALGANPSSIDPRFLADDEGAVVVDALFDSLVSIADDQVTIEPAAAVEWTLAEDGLTWTFTLRDGATYHDGRPVQAADFVRAFRRIVDRDARPVSFVHHQLAPVAGFDQAVEQGTPLSGVRAVDATTLEIELSRPAAEFLHVLAHPSLAPIPPAAEEDGQAWAARPVGNGPFAMAEAWQPNQFIRVTRFADHHRPARLDEVVFQIFADDPSRHQQYADFERGQLDVAEVPPTDLDEAVTTYGRSQDGTRGPGVLLGVTGALYAYGFNTEQPPFDDPAVRRAVSLLIDRDRIVDQLLLGAREAADTLVPPSLPGARAGRCDHCRYDPEAALAELSAPPEEATGSETEATPTTEPTATETDPVGPIEGPIEIVVNAGETNERIAARVAADVQDALGVDVRTRTAEPAAFVGEVRAGEVQLFRLAWEADHPSPGAILQPLFRSDEIGADNLTRFADEEVDALLDEARRTRDPAERQALYARAEERILALAPVAPIFFYRQNRVVSDEVVGLRIGPLGSVNLDEVWKQEAP